MPKQEKEKPEVVVEVDWSELPPELVDSIARKITEYVDYVKFRAVCVKWRSAVSPKPHYLLVQLPWLMLPYPDIGSFISLSENKIHCLNLPEIHSETRCVGSSLGWIVLVDETPNILLFNPITRIQFQLPPLTTFPYVLDYDVYNVGREYLIDYPPKGVHHRCSSICIRDSSIRKVVLSSSPSSPRDEDFIAVAIFYAQVEDQLAFCKKGDESWTVIDYVGSYCVDVIFCKGLFYAIDMDGPIAICDVTGLYPLVKIIEPSVPLSHYTNTGHLVDSFGELLLVTRQIGLVYDAELQRMVSKTDAFDVFMLDSSLENWIAVDSLGDHMLFLSTFSSLCLLATDFSGYEGNHVYFTNVDDSGVFNVRDGKFDPLPHCPRRSRLIWPCPPIWVTPNPC